MKSIQGVTFCSEVMGLNHRTQTLNFQNITNINSDATTNKNVPHLIDYSSFSNIRGGKTVFKK